MPTDILIGLLAGGLIGAGNALASLLLFYRSRDRPTAIFFRNVLGGMLVRLAVVLVAVVLVIQLAPIDISYFIGTLLATSVIGLILDIYFILKVSNTPTDTSS